MSNSSILFQSIKSNIQKLNQNINQIESLSQQIGTARDSNELRKRLDNLEHTSKELLASCQKNLKELNADSSTNRGDLKIQKDRLADELMKLINKLQPIMKSTLQKQRDFELPTNIKRNEQRDFDSNSLNYYTTNENENSNNFQAQQQAKMQRQEEYEMVKERQNQMKQLETDIVDLNSMFKDLAIMVHDQGEIIDNIENNITNTELTVTESNKQLTEANKYQSKARRKKLILALIVFVILIIIAAVILISLKPWAKK